jgi:hypothetical protein
LQFAGFFVFCHGRSCWGGSAAASSQ